MQKIAIVTGCSSGIGYETALELARNNYKVYATLMDSVPLIGADDVWQMDAQGNNCV